MRHEEDVFAFIASAKEARRLLLESAKLSVTATAQYYALMELRERKTSHLRVLENELLEARETTRQISELLPISEGEELQRLSGKELKRALPEDVKSAPEELVHIERSLHNLLLRLEQL